MFQRSYIRPTEQLTINYFYSGAVTGDTFTIRVLRADSDVQVAEFVTIAKDTGYVLVSVNPPNGAWLAGPYRIDVYYNDVKIKDGTVLCVPEPR
jgi:hypothetical protein